MINALFGQFHSAIASNAQFYLVYKVSSLLGTLMLYQAMPADTFNTWATLYSTIYLLMLWLGSGVQHTITRFAPAFNANPHLLYYLLSAQIVLIGLGLPVILLVHRQLPAVIILMAAAIYLMEGVYMIMESLYHAYFHNRFFNNRALLITIIEIALTTLCIFVIPQRHLLKSILLLKLSTTTTVNLMAISAWKDLPPPSITARNMPPSHQIIQYALYIWGKVVITSITERNMLLHIITQGMGKTVGNIFKVANDGARFFYRTIIKSIGSADTALLTHIELHESNPSKNDLLMREGIQKLSTQIGRLALPLLGIVTLLLIGLSWHYYDNIVFHAFLIMSVSYIGETIFLPYERMLEIKREYKTIMYIYIPYIITTTLLFIFITYTSIGFITFLMYVHGVRLVTGILMRIQVYRLYRI